ncbi:protein n-terminal asparagine amidohydrolase-like [Plakobranchus ocellatus]|uniref:Protein n-terminal asparagine amidohydrolase-like n=1 Tax=Plakobranchus ocellatus TaxID=259542 RepID=A0AAV3Y5C8_9GAST|nr:protein n-terminal asparagine amidohydrolase-like [Plakobranchus ocellatus]
MPLIIDGEQIKNAPTLDSFVKSFPQFKDSSDQLLKQNVQEVNPHGLLYVGQREVAGTYPGDDVISILGSEDATTCHLMVLRHTGSGAAALAHFDGSSIAEGLETMISIVADLTEDMSSGRLEAHLVGGFLDVSKNSHEVSDKVLEALCKSPYELNLVTACITHYNTVYHNSIPFPVIYGVAFDVRNGQLYRATFVDKGPDMAIRSARLYTGGKENLKIYDPQTHKLKIGPFHYGRLPNVDIFLSLPGSQIRQFLSTSPEQEPESFVESVRATLIQLRDFPRPLQTVFKGGKSRIYSKDKSTGKWIMQPS